jgi:metal-responsive CopG/Arc/MetJ family transcriptional regulator
MSQITVRLPDDLSRALRAAARKSQRRTSEIVRMALRAYLEPAPAARGKAYDRIRHLIGAFDSGIPDLAEKHSEYFLESLRRGR